MASFPSNNTNTERLEKLLSAFRNAFGGQEAEAVIQVPGRVNLIGEHIDYCGYGVHPMAIEQNILVAIAADKHEQVLHLANVNKNKYPDFKFDLSSTEIKIEKGQPHWWNYFLCGIKGVAEDVLSKNKPLRGMKCILDGEIPPSAGLSSSSAVVVSAAISTVVCNEAKCSRSDLADLCARSERFIGTQGGGMDQAIELLAEKGSAKLIEFNPLKATNVQLPEGALFVIANSLAEANKAAGSEFNQRVVECRLACKVLAKSLSIDNWRSVMKLKDVQELAKKTMEQMATFVQQHLHQEPYTKSELSSILGMSEKEIEQGILTENTKHLQEFKLFQRALHVYSEAGRVYQFKSACDEKKNLEELGKLMFDSHDSCTRLYECSHKQLDELVSLSKKHGALGARLTGAGWGGCIVALVPEERLSDFVKGLQTDYYDKLEAANGKKTSEYLFPTQPGAGACIYA